jgi:hypothetical protein
MTTLTCPRCGWTTWPSDNPAEIDAWRCCAPPQTLPEIDGYLTPGGSAPAGEADDALLPGPSLAEISDAAKACGLLLVGGCVGVGFVALVVRDLLGRIGGV